MNIYSNDNNKYQRIAKFMSIALVAMYAIVPLILNELGIYSIPWAEENFFYSLSLIFILFTLPLYDFKTYFFRFDFKENYFPKTVLLFFACTICFYLWGWHDDRESIGASLSALFRAFWLLFCFCFVNASERKKLFLLFLTAILVFIDQSRTYFMIAFFVLSLSSKNKKVYFSIGLAAILLVAAVRVESNISGIQILTYGIVGEGYNGAKSIGQVLQLDLSSFSASEHLLLTFLQPIYLPFQMIGNGLFSLGFPSQADSLGALTRNQLGETLSPMGGWYILSDFIIYKHIGIVYMFVYIHWLWWLCNRIFNTRYFPIGAFLFFLAIKATPFVFFKMMLYIFIIASLLTFLGAYKDKKRLLL
ncbi:MAG: hypothetical protein ACI902_003088 [Psychroserpens sp.]